MECQEGTEQARRDREQEPGGGWGCARAILAREHQSLCRVRDKCSGGETGLTGRREDSAMGWGGGMVGAGACPEPSSETSDGRRKN